ncbi:hypothetical protein GCM10018952_76470 [Streptosporangium vulgare]
MSQPLAERDEIKLLRQGKRFFTHQRCHDPMLNEISEEISSPAGSPGRMSSHPPLGDVAAHGTHAGRSPARPFRRGGDLPAAPERARTPGDGIRNLIPAQELV